MAAPTVTATLDRATYKPGDTALLTVRYGDPDTKPLTITVTVTDLEGNTSAPATVTAVIDPLTVAVVDSAGKAWTRVSDSGSVAVYSRVM